MLTKVERTTHEQCENFNKKIGNIRIYQTKIIEEYHN